MKIGVQLESLALPFRQALLLASRLGVGGVQFDAVGELHPERLSATGRRAIIQLLRTNNLEATALHCPLRHGLDEPTNLDSRITHLQKALTLSFDLGARRVIIDAGEIPDATDARSATLREAMTALAVHADRIGAMLCLQTGPEPGDKLATFLDSFSTGGLGVNYDPGNLLTNGHDPVANVLPLKKYIVHVYAHDAKRKKTGRPVALGAGDVDWMAMIGTLAAAEYHGWFVVRLDEPNAVEVENGVKFLRRLI